MSDPPDVETGRDALSAQGNAVWDDWETPPRTTSMPVLHLEGFDGSMDLLLDLAERQRIDFGRMSVLDLAEQFVAAMDRLVGRVPLERRADWLVLATRLVLLRSRLLFPASPEEATEAEQEADAALRQVKELGVARAAAAWLTARPQLGFDVFARPPATSPSREGGYVALMEACLVVLRGRGGQPAEALVYQPVIPDLWRVSDAMSRIKAVLAERPEAAELDCFLPSIALGATRCRLKVSAAISSTLLASLELARDGFVILAQDAPFGPINLASREPVVAEDLLG